LAFSILCILVLTGVIIGSQRSDSPFIGEFKAKYSFPLFYPTEIPRSYYVEPRSIYASNDAYQVLMNITDGTNNIVISQKAEVEGLGYESLNRNLKDEKYVDTRHGRVATGKNSDSKWVADIFTGKTWITIISPSDELDYESFVSLIKSFIEG